VEKQTGMKSRRPQKVFVDVNPLTLNSTTAAKRCVFVTFYHFWDGWAKGWLPVARSVATAFLGEPNVAVGLLDCPTFDDFCEKRMGWRAIPPKLILYVNGTVAEYDGDRDVAPVVSYLNEQCGTQRQISGALADTVGLIPQADAIVAEFLANKTKADEAVAKLTEIKGAELYVMAVKRVAQRGLDQIAKDIEKFAETLKLKSAAWQTLDSVKLRLNVFRRFVPEKRLGETEDCESKEDTCTPPQAPTQTPPPDENCSEEEEKCYPPTDPPTPTPVQVHENGL
jgi:hypothetical protein